MSFAKNSKRGIKKFNHWSAPAIMSAFLVICLIIIYSFETIGLSGREKNLELRKENIIIHHKIDKKTVESVMKISTFEREELKFSNKNHKLEEMYKILLDATENQMKYEDLNAKNQEVIDFYDV